MVLLLMIVMLSSELLLLNFALTVVFLVVLLFLLALTRTHSTQHKQQLIKKNILPLYEFNMLAYCIYFGSLVVISVKSSGQCTHAQTYTRLGLRIQNCPIDFVRFQWIYIFTRPRSKRKVIRYSAKRRLTESSDESERSRQRVWVSEYMLKSLLFLFSNHPLQ